MDKIQFLRGAALLPILVPIPIVVWALGSELIGATTPEWLAAPMATVLTGTLLFGLPYVVFALAALLLLRRRTWRAHLALAVVAPLIFTALLPLVFLSAGARGAAIWRQWAAFSKYALAVG